jgi:hypothetical protein
MGDVDFIAEGDEPEFLGDVVTDPDFFVVDDMYNEHDKLSIVESDPKFVTANLITALSDMALGFPDWWIRFSLGDSGLRISAGKLLLGGRRFWDCTSVEEVADRCSRPVEFGPEPPFPDDMYPLWVAAISGEYTLSAQHAEPPDRPWAEVIQTLNATASWKAGGKLTSFDYDGVRNDLHPAMRRKLAMKFLSELSIHPTVRVKAARRNLLADTVGTLLEPIDAIEIAKLVDCLSRGQQAAAAKLDDKDTVYWWSEVLHCFGEASEHLKPSMEAELRKLLNNSNPLIQLSAVFGLAKLRVNDIAGVVDNGFRANARWLANSELTKWLMKLRSGSIGYPGKSFLE